MAAKLVFDFGAQTEILMIPAAAGEILCEQVFHILATAHPFIDNPTASYSPRLSNRKVRAQKTPAQMQSKNARSSTCSNANLASGN
jgi:hypothetical protein